MKVESNLVKLSPNDITINPKYAKYAERRFNLKQISKDVALTKVEQLIAPLIIRRLPDNKSELVTGHRHLVVARQADVKKVSCLVFADDKQLIEPLQLLDWIHDVGEHVILRHPDAYAYYLQKKAQQLTKNIPFELKSEKSWNEFVRSAIISSLEAMLYQLFGKQHTDLVNRLLNAFKEYKNYCQTLDDLTNIIATEGFKIEEIHRHAYKLIDLLTPLLRLEATKDLAWVENIKVNSTFSPELIYPISLKEASDIFNSNPINLGIYQKRTEKTVTDGSNQDLITKKKTIRKREINVSRRTLADSCDYKFSESFLNDTIKIMRKYPSNILQNVYRDAQYAPACQKDFQKRLQTQLQVLYDKLRRDAVQTPIDKEYIKNCFGQLNIINAIYQPFKLQDEEARATQTIYEPVERLFIGKMLMALSNQEKVKFHLQTKANEVEQDVNIRNNFVKLFKSTLLKKRDGLEVTYAFADSQSLKIISTAELLGTLLFMHRSYKHFVKQRLLEKSIFFKKRIKFSTAKDYLGDDKVLSIADGISEFIFMIDLNGLGIVTTELKITTTAKFDFHVKQFHSYCRDLTEQEKERLGKEADKTKKSSFYETAFAMAAKIEPAPKGAEVDQIIAKWMGNLLKLIQPIPPEMKNLPFNVQDNVLRLLCVYVFMMFYIEGLRNPGAFVVHPLVLRELIAQPLEKLDQYIIKGKFVMTPPGSKENGENIARFLYPNARYSGNIFSEVEKFSYYDMASQEVAVVKEHQKNQSLEIIEEQLLEMFKLGKNV